MSKCEQFGELLSGYLDGELTPQTRQRVEIHLETCAACQQTYNEFEQLHQSVGRVPFEKMTPQERKRIVNDLPARASRWIGLLLFLGGLLALWGYGIYESMTEEPVAVQIAAAAMIIGLVVLFFSVLRDRLKARKSDNYKDVDI